jgi:predicted metalloprotease
MNFRRSIAAAMVCLLTPLASFASPTASPQVKITASDVAAVQKHINAAQFSFQETWKSIFSPLGQNTPAPKVIAFQDSIMTGCGLVKKDNGYFCDDDRTIYLDAEFLAGEMKSAAAALGTDGDYAAIVVAAHEYGHAIARQLRLTYPNEKSTQEFADEQTADCFAGVITHQEKLSKHLEPDDFEEGLYSISMAGDDRVAGLNYDTMDQREAIRYILTRPVTHGHADDREVAYVSGFYGGMRACSKTLGGAILTPASRAIFTAGPQLPTSAAGHCTLSKLQSGFTVKDVSYSDDFCQLHELSSSTTRLPADYRVEVDTTLFVPPDYTPARTLATLGGILFVDGQAPKSPARIGFYVNTYDNHQVINLATGNQIRGSMVNDFYQYVAISPIGKVNHLALDIHRSRGNLYLLAFINNKLARVMILKGETGQSPDTLGILAAHATDTAIFQNFRVSALPD